MGRAGTAKTHGLRPAVAAFVLAIALAAGIAAADASVERAAAAPAREQTKPNVVFLLSDDQTQEEMRFMPNVRSLIGDAGATFPTTVTNWPLCCPSRATMQTGQYAHNHGVLGNQPPLGGFDRLNLAETLPVWLQRDGYYTAHIGKFLNGYEDSDVGVPPGWSEWHGSKTTYTYYGYKLLEDGQINTYGSNNENADAPAQPETYSTDVYTDKAVDVINRRAPSDQPFYLSVAYLAPHSGGPNNGQYDPAGRCEDTAKPAIRHAGTYSSLPRPRPPNFDEADVSDKPAGIAGRDALTPREIRNATRNYRCRAEALLAIDEGAKRVIDALRASGELDNTLIIYASDNGFFHGEHRIANGKNRVYEEAIRVPLLMRGPGIPRGVTDQDIAINADIPATIIDAAGATAGLPQDGQSLLPFAEHPDRKHGRELLIEQASPTGEDGEPVGNDYSAVRNSRYKYVENTTGEVELYDLLNDPYELNNLHANPAYAEVETALAARLATLRSCAGQSCRTKPSIQMKLPRQVHEQGRKPCTPAGGFLVRVRNHAQSRLVEVSYAVDGKTAVDDHSEPFDRRIPATLLRGQRKPEVTADATLVDGRVLTLHADVRICR
jgi:N-acetylglucosamine-6-sulfatase